MPSRLDVLARMLWYADGEAVKLVATLGRTDRRELELRIESLYGAKVSLIGTEAEIRASLQRAKDG